MASGDVVNTAARLQSAAPVNGVVVDETTQRATRHAIAYRETEPVAAKGKAEPIAIWEAVEARARFGPEVLDHVAGELVGREREVGLLRDGPRRRARGALAAARDARRRPRHRQEPPAARALPHCRRRGGAHDLATGQMPRIRGRRDVLGAGRDRESPGRHSRGGRRNDRGREAPPSRRGNRGLGRRRMGRRSPAPAGRARGRVGARGQQRNGGLRGLAALLRGARRAASADPRLRGSPMGRRGPARLRRRARRLGDRRADAGGLHGPTRAACSAPELGWRQAQCLYDRARAAVRRGDRPADGHPARTLGAPGRRPADPARTRRRQPPLRRAVRPAVPRARLRRGPAAPRDVAGHHQRSPRWPARRREGIPPRGSGRREGLLDGRPRQRKRRLGNGRARTGAKGLPATATALVGSRRARARIRARTRA